MANLGDMVIPVTVDVTVRVANMPVVPEVVLPEGVAHDRHDGPTWILMLPDGRELRLAEPFEGEFTIERCDVGE